MGGGTERQVKGGGCGGGGGGRERGRQEGLACLPVNRFVDI